MTRASHRTPVHTMIHLGWLTLPCTALALGAHALPAAPQTSGEADRLVFLAEPGTKVHKRVKFTHELRVDDMGRIDGDTPFVSDKNGGWISGSMGIQFVDEYVRCAENLPLEFVRTIRESQAQGKANITYASGQKFEEPSRSMTPLRKQNIRFTWVESEGDWSRAYEKIDAEEPWLRPLRGEFELLPLLPKSPVKPGETWSIDPATMRHVFAPGGNLQLVPTGGGHFGRMMELGVAGDFADFFEPAGGSVGATYRGRRELDVDGVKVTVGVVELDLNLVSFADRVDLYRMAMPSAERRESSRTDSVPIEYTLQGKGELLWNLALNRAHSLHIEGQEGFVATIWKTFYTGRTERKYAQQTFLSGPLVFDVTFADGSKLEAESELDNPKVQGKRGK